MIKQSVDGNEPRALHSASPAKSINKLFVTTSIKQ